MSLKNYVMHDLCVFMSCDAMMTYVYYFNYHVIGPNGPKGKKETY
jgi:hypothetical protein